MPLDRAVALTKYKGSLFAMFTNPTEVILKVLSLTGSLNSKDNSPASRSKSNAVITGLVVSGTKLLTLMGIVLFRGKPAASVAASGCTWRYVLDDRVANSGID